MDPRKQEIRDFVAKTFKSKAVKGIYASYVAKHVSASPQEVQAELVEMYNEGLVGIQYELICPNCARTMDTKPHLSEFKTEYECMCGEEVEDIQPSQIKVRFMNPVAITTRKDV